MHSLNSLALLSGLSLVHALPSVNVEKRQNPSQTIGACTDSACSDCPVTYKTGTGFPECNVYNVADLTQYGFTVSDTGLSTVYFNAPPLDAGCKIVIQTPVTQDTSACGGNVLVVEGATCAPVQLDSTLIIEFCCGTDDCNALGAPGKRDTSSNPQTFSKFNIARTPMILQAADGTEIHPRPLADVKVEQEQRAAKRAEEEYKAAKKAARALKKRDCDSFTVTNGPYTRAGPNYAISQQVTCGPTEGCMAQEEKSVTQTFSLDVSVSVGDPFGIISATVDVGWSKSVERSFSATYMFGAGETGYVEFIPILTCVDGHFEGDCDGSGQATTGCAATETNGEMTGNIRGVIVRGN